jgi:hypothetical protein
VGLWSAWLIAVAPWPINLSRIGLRAVSMPLVVATALWLWWSGRRKRGVRRWLGLVLGGAFLGLSLYTYTAARLVLLAVGLAVLFQAWVSHEPFERSELLVLALAAWVAMTPLIAYGIAHWDTFVERSAQVSILSPEINQGDPLGTLAGNVFRALGLFTFRGDFIPRHNVPLRPLFDPLVSAFFVMGVLLCLGQARTQSGGVLALIWTAVMLTPTILAEDCPHFLRAVGVLPMAAVFPAYGLEWTRQRLGGRGLGRMGNGLVGIVLVASAVWGGYDYFIRHGRDPELAYAFEADQVQEAVEINRFLGTGWQGQGIAEPQGAAYPDRHVYLAPRMWEDRLSVNFLVRSPERVSILGRDAPVEADQVLVLAWPYGEMSGVRDVFPSPARIEVWPGPMERGDLDLEARLLYVAFGTTRLDDRSPAIARFEQGIELVGWEIEAREPEAREPEPGAPGETLLRLRWRATQVLETDYTVFVHMARDGSVFAQDDGMPAHGFYPTSWWRPGDELVDEHTIAARDDSQHVEIWIGLYEWASMRHLRVLGANGQPGEDRLALRP